MSRFLRRTLAAAATAAAAMSLPAAPAHAAPPVPNGCAWQSFVIGGLSMCAPSSVNFHQVEVLCHLLGRFPYMHFSVWGPAATSLPSIALCPPLHVGLGGTVHTR
ncbi:hypothetical protein C5613_30250 [Rhodococcus opacus]|uniref:Secreted protein n=1 Tax=Rhodococcus opacus TaxID=37919 RepID=A0A2S8IXY6_RHOOP|nr:hypothetical protein C5613_30250 [Rhodococcus opacus]